jgi:hypothetical protein
MRAHVFLLAAGLALAAGAALRAADTGTSPRVQVTFDHPENFTDVKDRSDPTDEGRDAILDMLRVCIVTEAGKHLPAGARLSMTFTDVDLAGDFEPWRGPQYDSIRIVRPAYPPAFKFSYTITDAAGRVWKSGKEGIRDLNFEEREILDTSDSLRIEKSVLRDWVRDILKGMN